jgi:hypothetical protein
LTGFSASCELDSFEGWQKLGSSFTRLTILSAFDVLALFVIQVYGAGQAGVERVDRPQDFDRLMHGSATGVSISDDS